MTASDEAPVSAPTNRSPVVTGAACLFGALTFGLSWWRWWTFQYRTFDLAFYVQSLWLAVHGKWQVSLLDVPLLGNHAEPIVFLLTPLFAIWPHPMLLVGIQTLALASMPFTATRIAKRLEMKRGSATALACLTVAVPAAGFIALHEFHPEALAAPLLLLLYEARVARNWPRYLLWFGLMLSCKENLALLLIAWGVVLAWCDRTKESTPWQWRWNIGPALVAAAWFGLYVGWVAPHLNGGRVDYGNLYSDLWGSGGTAAPAAWGRALWRGLTGGNLGWSMLAAFAGLPLLRPRWLLIAAPLLLQHLLSSRPSEWTIHFHYAAPLLPLFWIAAAEATAQWKGECRPVAAGMALGAALLQQILIGPFRTLPAEARYAGQTLRARETKAEFVEGLAADKSLRICAGIPYLSHLATREELYSLHFVLKGLRTLSAHAYTPTYTPDAVLIDYADGATFNIEAGYYHPEGEWGGLHLPSSDELLNRFLSGRPWAVTSVNALTLLRPAATEAAIATFAEDGPLIDFQTALQSIAMKPLREGVVRLDLDLKFLGVRKRIPWLTVIFSNETEKYAVLVGMCAPQGGAAGASEHRLIRMPEGMKRGQYQVSAAFADRVDQLWGAPGMFPPRSIRVGRVARGE